MERKALEELIKWKDDKYRKPLMVWGGRQTGKTYLIRDIFARRYFPDNYIYVDFKVEDEIRDFCNSTASAAKIIEFISLFKEKRIDKNTLLIFDEIQECLNAVSSLKYFCQDYPEIPVIATGSMVRIRIQRYRNSRGPKNEGGFLFPTGKINELTIYPMTFEEFLINANKMLYDNLAESFDNMKHLSVQVHEMAMDYLYKYLLVGGMPEALSVFIEEKDLLKSRKLLKELYNNYLSDMELYQVSRESILKSRSVFENIYAQLNKESKNFKPGLIKEGSKTRDYDTPVNWLRMAHIVNLSYELKERVTTPLINKDDNSYRLYLGDIGMFSYQSGINAASFIAKDRENTLSGVFFENYVANELVAHDQKLFYWKGKDNNELEFIVESDSHLYPIDVKKGKGMLNSLEKFSNHNKYDCAIKISAQSFGYDATKRLLTIPLYYTSFLCERLREGTLKKWLMQTRG